MVRPDMSVDVKESHDAAARRDAELGQLPPQLVPSLHRCQPRELSRR
jgi:hypothetical protein